MDNVVAVASGVCGGTLSGWPLAVAIVGGGFAAAFAVVGFFWALSR